LLLSVAVAWRPSGNIKGVIGTYEEAFLPTGIRTAFAGAGGHSFPTPGSFGYHSQTDVTYSNSAACNCVVPNFTFNGLINVTP